MAQVLLRDVIRQTRGAFYKHKFWISNTFHLDTRRCATLGLIVTVLWVIILAHWLICIVNRVDLQFFLVTTNAEYVETKSLYEIPNNDRHRFGHYPGTLFHVHCPVLLQVQSCHDLALVVLVGQSPHNHEPEAVAVCTARKLPLTCPRHPGCCEI